MVPNKRMDGIQLELLPPETETALESLPSQSLAFVGQKTYDGNIARFNRWNKGRAINAERILEFFDYLTIEKNLKPVTLMNYRFSIKAALKSELTDLRQLMAIDAFFKKMKNVKKDNKIYEEETLGQEAFEKLKKVCSPKITLIVTVLYHSGMRISEALGIRMKDCEIAKRYVSVSILGKGSKVRHVFIARPVFDEIVKVFDAKEFLFQSPGKNGKYSREHIARQIGKYARQAIPNTRIHPHTFRHTFATRHIKAKGSVKAVANYLGHASTSTTEQMYLHDQMSLEELWPAKLEKEEAA